MAQDYRPPLADIGFLLFDALRAPAHWQALPAHAGTDAALARQVLEEAAAFVAGRVAPLQAVGDAVGCRFDPATGAVAAPPGFADAYRDFWQAGWPTLSCDPADGGQGLPWLLEGVLYELLAAANHGWTMAPGLLHGAYECIRHHGGEALRAAWLPKVASGEWLATMCLTESHAGSDLGRIRTKGTPVEGDPAPAEGGRLRVRGAKVFISGGEHDLSDNIVHLVLGRLPGAPAGPKGLSLFLVPKFLADGSRNPVACERIEEKMGLHGSPTCAMRFDDATGWLVGAPHRGLAAMFTMMNAARLHVALQGVGLLDAAWQKADDYARERRQMRAPADRRAAAAAAASPAAPAALAARSAAHGEPSATAALPPVPAPEADLLSAHPAMRRILDTQRAWIDGGRLLAYRTALALDDARHHPEADARARAERWCALATPVLKAAWTAQAFDGASACLQVFGGHGYIREWGIEQIVRDARVTMIYEGTNEIQAIDLLVRKVLSDGGAALGGWLDDLRAECPDAAARGRFDPLADALRAVTGRVADAAPDDAALPHRVADDYLRAVALLLLAWAWERIGAVAPADDPRWALPARAMRERVLPGFAACLALVAAQLPAQLPAQYADPPSPTAPPARPIAARPLPSAA
jgi:alkylation response protein AidB-like acyl-CoA dehydrogenase